MPETEAAKNNSVNLFIFNTPKDYIPWAMMTLVIVFTVFQLRFLERIWWCKLDTVLNFWTFDAWSYHTSQHFIDPYFFTHVLHGFLFLWLTNIVFDLIFKIKISKAWLLSVAVIGESAWKILENSSTIIELYRTNTASLDYFGDSIANSIGDIIACAIGFIVAYELRFWRALAVFSIVEIVLVLSIKDSLLINIIMLIYPIEAIKVWQSVA